MRRSRLLLTGAILGTVYLLYLIVVGYLLLNGLAALPQTAYILGHPISFDYLMLHALGGALAVVFAWLAFALSGGALALIALALCALAAACAPLLGIFFAPTAGLMLAGFIGLRKARAERRRRKSDFESALPEAIPLAAAPSPAPREDDDKESRADPVTIAMVALCVLVVAAIVGVVLYGVFLYEPPAAPAAELADEAGDENADPGDEYYTADDEENYDDGEEEAYDEDEEDPGEEEPDEGELTQIEGMLPGVADLLPGADIGG